MSDNEWRTLREHNVQPGDVVRHESGWTGEVNSTHYYGVEIVGRGAWDWQSPEFMVISRASQPVTVSPTELTPQSVMQAEIDRLAMMVEGLTARLDEGPEWIITQPNLADMVVALSARIDALEGKAQPEPKGNTVVMYGKRYIDGEWLWGPRDYYDTHTLTFEVDEHGNPTGPAFIRPI